MAFLNLDISRVDTADIRCWMKGRFTKNSGVYQSDSVTMTLKERYSVESGGIYTFELSDANVYLSIVEYDSSYQYVGVVEVYSGGAYSPSNGVEYVAVNIEWEPGYVSSAQELFDNGLIINIAKEEKAELPTQNDYTETLVSVFWSQDTVSITVCWVFFVPSIFQQFCIYIPHIPISKLSQMDFLLFLKQS